MCNGTLPPPFVVADLCRCRRRARASPPTAWTFWDGGAVFAATCRLGRCVRSRLHSTLELVVVIDRTNVPINLMYVHISTSEDVRLGVCTYTSKSGTALVCSNVRVVQALADPLLVQNNGSGKGGGGEKREGPGRTCPPSAENLRRPIPCPYISMEPRGKEHSSIIHPSIHPSTFLHARAPTPFGPLLRLCLRLLLIRNQRPPQARTWERRIASPPKAGGGPGDWSCSAPSRRRRPPPPPRLPPIPTWRSGWGGRGTSAASRDRGCGRTCRTPGLPCSWRLGSTWMFPRPGRRQEGRARDHPAPLPPSPPLAPPPACGTRGGTRGWPSS